MIALLSKYKAIVANGFVVSVLVAILGFPLTNLIFKLNTKSMQIGYSLLFILLALMCTLGIYSLSQPFKANLPKEHFRANVVFVLNATCGGLLGLVCLCCSIVYFYLKQLIPAFTKRSL